MKLKEEKITKDDLIEYTDNYSDFSFEMKVLNCLPDSFKINHGGTYEDPVSGKYREFDIRAEYSKKKGFTKSIYMAIEVKNTKENFPLLVSCIPRKQEEAFHHLIVSKHRGHEYVGLSSHGRTHTVRHSLNKLYDVGNYIGKSLDQVGRKDARDKELIGNDSDIYSKWSQAVNSSNEIAEKAFFKSSNHDNNVFVSFIMPIVVIPDKTLWIAKYDKDGNRKGDIIQVEECQYFIGNKIELGDKVSNHDFTLTHLHIMTYSKFKKFVNEIDGHIDTIFPESERYF